MAAPQFLSRRRFLRALVGAGVASPTVAHCAEESATLEIIVDGKGWGASSLAEVRAVLQAAAGEIWRCCPGEMIRPIRVHHRADFPQTDFLRDWRGRIRIGLACDGGNWAQMAFQFGHEFLHALAQHSAAARRAWRTPRHANLWFEECLCETAALFVLRRRGATPEFAKFAADRLARPDHQLPTGQTFEAWFRAHEPSLRANPAQRAKNVIVAAQMLPLFEAVPAAWASACYLNLGRRDREKTRAQYFAEWQAASPPAHRLFLSQVAALYAAEA